MCPSKFVQVWDGPNLLGVTYYRMRAVRIRSRDGSILILLMDSMKIDSSPLLV